MKKEIINKNGVNIAVISSTEKLITDTQSAVDFIMTINYETNCRYIALNKESLIDDFFVLSTRIAGEILQKFVTYQIKFAIYGDFSKYTSKPLKDFIYESNNGNNIFFTQTQEEAIEKLSNAK